MQRVYLHHLARASSDKCVTTLCARMKLLVLAALSGVQSPIHRPSRPRMHDQWFKWSDLRLWVWKQA
jgi:hypothetical protein